MGNKRNIIDELGELALSTRLMRLAEWTRKDVTRIYKESGIPFESKWFPLLYVLSRRSPLGVVELAEELGYTHPSVIELVREMEKKGLVKAKISKEDRRKRLLELTAKARKYQEKMQPLWDQMRVVAGQIYNNGSSLLGAITDVEQALRECSYYDRFQKIGSRLREDKQE